jgi:hypothetical protein
MVGNYTDIGVSMLMWSKRCVTIFASWNQMDVIEATLGPFGVPEFIINFDPRMVNPAGYS